MYRCYTHLHLAGRHVQMLRELLSQLAPGALLERENSLQQDDILGLQHPPRAGCSIVADPEKDLLQGSPRRLLAHGCGTCARKAARW